jgi:hypothetical protein
MRTSLNNIKEIERYILGGMDQADDVTFQRSVQRDPILRVNVTLMKKVMTIVRLYHRKKLKLELEEVHRRLVNDPMKWRFNESVQRIFRDN